MAIYYVKNGGNDGLDGLSDTNAWETIAKVNGFTFAAGDTISFKCGSTWREQLNMPRSGVAGNYMKFNSYSTGNKPVILGSNLSLGWEDQGGNIWKSSTAFTTNPRGSDPWYSEIFFYNLDGTVSWGDYEINTGAMTVEYDWTWAANYIYVYATTDPTTRYTKIEIPQRQYCIWIDNDEQYIEIDGLELRHATKVNIYDNEPRSALSGYTIKNCLLCYVGNKTELDGCGYNHHVSRSNMLIYNNEMHNGGRRQISINWYSVNGTNWDNIIIDGNYLHDGYHGSGFGCDVTDNSNNHLTNLIVRNNKFYQDPDFGLNPGDAKSTFGSIRALKVGGQSTITGVYVYNNIYYYVSNYCLQIQNIDDVYIFNNVFYDLNSHFASYAYHIQIAANNSQTCTNVNIKNNIFYNARIYATEHSHFSIDFFGTQDPAEVVFDYNLFKVTDTSCWLITLADLYTPPTPSRFNTANWATLKSIYGWQTHEPTLNSDPDWVNAPNDLHLLAESPCIGAGTTPIYATDYDGNLWLDPPSIGSFEYGTSPPDGGDGSDEENGSVVQTRILSPPYATRIISKPLYNQGRKL